MRRPQLPPAAPRRRLIAILAALAIGCGLAIATTNASAATTPPLPARLKNTGGGTQLITAVASGSTNASRGGTLTWWQRNGSTWVKVGSAYVRFGYHGLSDKRLEGDGTTPTGLYTLPLAFGIRANPGTRMPYNTVDAGSWWDENSLSTRYNTWYENCPPSICWTSATKPAHSSEHLASYNPQYRYALFIGFNNAATKIRPPARPSGSGIFLHVNGTGSTAGCLSVPQGTMVALLKWLNPAAHPHIAIGNTTSILRF